MSETNNILIKHKASIGYGISLAILLILLKWLELRFIIFHHSFEIYIGVIAVLFTGLGIWLALKISRPKVRIVVVEKEIVVSRNDPFIQDKAALKKLDISKREMEILELLAQGYSNQEIGSRLYISMSTVKTHNQNLFEKLEVKRRIQAVEKARQLQLIP